MVILQAIDAAAPFRGVSAAILTAERFELSLFDAICHSSFTCLRITIVLRKNPVASNFGAVPVVSQVAIGSAGLYVGLVQTGGAWDSKTWAGNTPENIAAGNINFGVTCSQFGFNTWLGGQACQFGAGIYGKFQGKYGSPIFSQYHGDWPGDNEQIRQGLAMAKKGDC